MYLAERALLSLRLFLENVFLPDQMPIWRNGIDLSLLKSMLITTNAV